MTHNPETSQRLELRDSYGQMPLSGALRFPLINHTSLRQGSHSRTRPVFVSWTSAILLDILMFKDIDSRKLNIKNARFGTGEWLFTHPDYQEWLHSAPSMQKPGVLWISGQPGAGKSMIMKSAYLNMKRGTGNQHAVTASFFFNKEGGYLERSIVGMYRSLLLQLLEGCPDIQIMMDDSTMASLSYRGCPSLHVLKHLFCQAVFALGQRSFFCFIDALDECDEREAADLMQYFDNLTKISAAASCLFRVCVSGGGDLSISHHYRTRIILEDQPGHVKDLESTIARRLHAGTSTLVEGLHSKLLHKAAKPSISLTRTETFSSRGKSRIVRRVTELRLDKYGGNTSR